MNNAVYIGGECVGYRCFTCGGIFQSMWDCTCNGCRAKERQHKELMQQLRELTEATKNKQHV